MSSQKGPTASRLRREMGLFSAVSVIVGNSIGSAIFIGPSIVYQDAGSGGADLLVWIVGGAASLIHAFCTAELGTLLPSAGGSYEYVNVAAKSMGRLGELLTFFFLWTFLLMDAASVTINGFTFTKYALSLAYGTCPLPYGVTALITMVVIGLAAAVNVFSLKTSMKTQNVFFTLKLAILLGIIITGTAWCIRAPRLLNRLSLNGHTTPGNLVSAFAIALFPGAGSATIAFMAEEISDPSRTIPRSLVGGTVFVVVLVVLTNAAYFLVLDADSIAATEATATTFSRAAWGTAGEFIVPVVICVCTFGTLSSMFLTNSRLFMAAARQGHLPSLVNLISVNSSLPVVAIAFRSCIAIPFALTGSVTFLVKGGMNFYCLNVVLQMLAMLRLRVTMRDVHRPVRVPTWFIFVNIGVSVVVIAVPTFSATEFASCAISIGCIMAGIPVYFLCKAIRCRVAGTRLYVAAQKLFLGVPCAQLVKLK